MLCSREQIALEQGIIHRVCCLCTTRGALQRPHKDAWIFTLSRPAVRVATSSRHVRYSRTFVPSVSGMPVVMEFLTCRGSRVPICYRLSFRRLWSGLPRCWRSGASWCTHPGAQLLWHAARPVCGPEMVALQPPSHSFPMDPAATPRLTNTGRLRRITHAAMPRSAVLCSHTSRWACGRSAMPRRLIARITSIRGGRVSRI